MSSNPSETVAPGASPTSIPDTQPSHPSPLAPASAAAAPSTSARPPADAGSCDIPVVAAQEERESAKSPPIDPKRLNHQPAPLPDPESTQHSGGGGGDGNAAAHLTSPPLRDAENPLDSAYLDNASNGPHEPASHPTVAETGPMPRRGSESGPGPKSGQLERKERKVGEGIIKLGSFGGEGLAAKPPKGLQRGDDEAVE